jgi:yeast amino acid transporter
MPFLSPHSIRFRRAWKVQGHDLRELPYLAYGGVYGSWFGVVLITLVLIAQFYIAIWPIGGMAETGTKVAEEFFKVYLAAPIMLGFWVAGYSEALAPLAVMSCPF